MEPTRYRFREQPRREHLASLLGSPMKGFLPKERLVSYPWLGHGPSTLWRAWWNDFDRANCADSNGLAGWLSFQPRPKCAIRDNHGFVAH